MDVLKFDEFKKTWHQIAKYDTSDIDNVALELQIHKKLLNLFHTGPYYFYIFCTATTTIEYTSNEVLNILKLSNTNLFTPQFVYENLHPEDQIRFINFENQVTAFFNSLEPEKIFKYKVSYDFRLKDAEGNYQWILHQATTIQSNEAGAVLRILGVHTLINHLKTNEEPSGLTFIGLEGEPSFFNVNVTNTITPTNPVQLTKREKAIAQLLILGKTSAEIAEILHISLHTVSTHRKNMLKKMDCNTTAELIVKVMQLG